MKEKILEHFKNNDPVMSEKMTEYGLDLLKKEETRNYFYSLCRNIAYQQLSGKAAGTIFDRFLNLVGDDFSPERVLVLEHEEIRAVGLSNSKASYIKNIAEAFQSGRVTPKLLEEANETELVRMLTEIKGVGVWTAEMFMMFTLGKEDVFSFGDLGLKKGITKLYGFSSIPEKDVIQKIVEKWSPYKTYASMTLWKIADNII